MWCVDSLFYTKYWSLPGVMPALQYHGKDTLFLLCWRRWMVSRGDIEQKTDQFFKHYTGVSKAVWPSSLHRYFALGKGRRRFMLLRRLLSLYRRHFDYLFDAMQVFSKRLFAACSCTVHVVVVVVASDIIEFCACFITGQSNSF